ncbi:hypothetical protein BGZ94_007644 [Podila epigama]|nr:hypothetical protein BGZ94_007644 [Podila epigama]
MARVAPLTVDIPDHSPAYSRDNLDGTTNTCDTPGYFQSKNESSFAFTRTGSPYLASPSSLVSPMTTPALPMSSPRKDVDAKAMGQYEFPSVKVDSLYYQTYLNHPFHQQIKSNHAKTSPRLHKQNEQNIKYANYTKSSDFKLVTTDLPSPTSPPPPPYIPSSTVTFDNIIDNKNQDVVSPTVARPKLARVLPQQPTPTITSGPTPTLTNSPTCIDAQVLPATATIAVITPSESTTATTMHHVNVQFADVAVPIESKEENTPVSFPGFWEDARQQRLHWVALPLGCGMLASAIWAVMVMQVFVGWVVLVPATMAVLGALQFGRYRWQKNRFARQQNHKYNNEQQYEQEQRHETYSHQDRQVAFLEPHQPLSLSHDMPSYQHASQYHQTHQDHPTYNNNNNNNNNNSDNVNNVTFQQQAHKQPRQQKKHPSPKIPMTVNPALYRPSAAHHGQFLSPMDSPQTPPPAYFLKRIELPEINSVGDLVSEFEIDLNSFKY